VDDEHRANFFRWVKKLFRSCERLDGRKRCIASSHFGSPGKWTAAELKLTRSLGYGTYRFQMRDVSQLEPSALLTLINLGRRWYREQPARVGTLSLVVGDTLIIPTFIMSFSLTTFQLTLLPFGRRLVSTHIRFRWEPGKVSFRRWQDQAIPPAVVSLNQPRVYLRCAFPGGRIGAHRLVCISSRPYPAKKRK